MRMTIPGALTLTCALLATVTAYGDSAATNPVPTPRETNKRIVAGWHERDAAMARTNAALFVRPGLFADRAARRVRVYGESIRLNLGDPVEFLLISESSGKDYEAMAVSFAAPSDLHRALEFIGLKPGGPVNADGLRFWPRGERVRMTFDLLAADGSVTPVGAAESTIFDTRTNAPLRETGFVFCGGRWTTPPDDTPATGLVYAADVFSPNALVSIYNEGNTVLDLPRRAPQSEVYTFQVPNPDRRLPAAGLLQATFTPLFTDSGTRLVDWTMRLRNAADGAASFTVTDAAGKTVLDAQSAAAVTAAAKAVIASGHDLFSVFVPDDAVTLGSLTSACAAVETMEDTLGLRVEPPPAGHPYYKTFLPSEAHRDRANRPMQPFELVWSASSPGTTGILSLATEEWKGGDDEPVYRHTSWPVASPGDLSAPFSHKDAPAVLLMFAPPTMSYGRIRSYAAVAVARRMIVYVFIGQPTGTLKSAPEGKTP